MARYYFLVLFGFLFMAACAHKPTTAGNSDMPLSDGSLTEAQSGPIDWKKKYIGFSGMFRRPPVFSNDKEKERFDRCQPMKIVGFSTLGDQIIMEVNQGKKNINLIGLNRESFRVSADGRIAQLDKYFVKKLDLVERSVASVGQKLCSGQLWRNMSKEEFAFISGDPDLTQNSKGKKGGYEQWIFKGRDPQIQTSYYFLKDRLWSWR